MNMMLIRYRRDVLPLLNACDMIIIFTITFSNFLYFISKKLLSVKVMIAVLWLVAFLLWLNLDLSRQGKALRSNYL